MKHLFLPAAGLATVLALFAPGKAAVLHVPADFGSISDAVNAASQGDTIEVAAGIYYEAVTIAGRALTLRGSGAEITDLEGWISIADVPLGTAHVRGFTCRVPGCGNAIKVENAWAVIEDCCITGAACSNTSAAVKVQSGAHVSLRNNRIQASTDVAAAVYVRDSWADITHNLIWNNRGYARGGVYLRSSTARLQHNTIIYNTTTHYPNAGGFEAAACDSVILLDNIIAFNSGWSVAVEDSTALELEYNDVFAPDGGTYVTIGWFANIGSSPTNLGVDPKLTSPQFLPAAGSPVISAASDGSNIGLDSAVCDCAPPPPPPVCGNGIRETGEGCDDGNTDCFDGCDGQCHVEPGTCSIHRTGDVNQDCYITSADVIGLVNFVFKGGITPVPCKAAGDVNCSGSVTSADIIGLVGYIFKGGVSPCDACTSPLAGECP